MGAFGDRMRREREMRGVTLEEISESTKISKRALQALEEEDFDLLPGGIFNKGFVRAYARFLGIDEEQAVADFLAVNNEQQVPEDKFPLELREKEDQPPLNPKRSLGPVILALLLLVAVAGAWTFWTKHKAQESATESQARSATKAPDQPSTAPLTLSPDNTNPASSSANQVTANPNSTPPDQKSLPADSSTGGGSSSSPEPAPLQPPVATDSTTKQNPPTEASGIDGQSSSDSAQAKKAFTVSVKATEDSWVSIVADGKSKMEGILNAEKQKSVTAGKELVLVTGNAGGIEVRYNGKLVPPLGEKQHKRTLTFTLQGIQQ